MPPYHPFSATVTQGRCKAAVEARRGALLHRPRRQRAGARLRVFRGGAGTAICGASALPRRGPAHRRQHHQAAGGAAEGLTQVIGTFDV
jgi:hypothetical protein